MTQIEHAKQGDLTPEIQQVAQKEGMEPETLAQLVANGQVVILKNSASSYTDAIGLGKGLRTKVNANIGTSPQFPDVKREIEKTRIAVQAGADTIMDLSTGGDLDAVRRAIRQATSAPLGTVPIYQAAIETATHAGGIIKMTVDDLFAVLERQAKDGVDFFTVHCGVTLSALERLRQQGRLMNIVSRGGSFLITWMIANERENPLYEHFDRLLELAHRYDIVLSLGDGMRPGALADATDRAQVQELLLLGELTKRAWEYGVQVMIEGPGHLPLDHIETNVRMEKLLCHGAPFYVLGPLVTDVAPGYDHIVSAIGGALAAWAGADFLCYVTPGEHLRLPSPEDVRQGVIVARIAAHAADIAKSLPGASNWDLEMAKARKQLNWKKQFELAIDPELAQRLYTEATVQAESSEEKTQTDIHISEKEPIGAEPCSMCGKYCAIKLVEKALKDVKPLA